MQHNHILWYFLSNRKFWNFNLLQLLINKKRYIILQSQKSTVMQLFVVEDKKIRRVDGQLNHKQMQHVLVSCVCKLSQAIGGLWSLCVLLRESNFAVAILIVFVDIYVSISCTSLFCLLP